MTILEAMKDPALFGDWFASPSWDAWRVFLAALFGLPMTDEQREVYQRHTARESAPSGAFRESWVVAGRRGGKSLIAALVTVFLACFRDYRRYLKPGEVGTVAVIAADRRQARTILRYVRGLLGVALLRPLVVNDTAESIELSNGVVIEVHTASFRSVRGYTLLAVIADETAFWRSDESANPDKEILTAVRPGLATIPGGVLLAISSPYARRGALWDAHRRHFAKDASPVLVWQADSKSMNPTLPDSVIAQAYEDDEPAARAEYGAQFRSDVETYVSTEVIEACIVEDRHELPPIDGVRYVGFADPAGGSGQDSFAMAVAHKEKDGRLLLDAVRERKPPFSPEQATAEFASVFQRYGVSRIRGDRFAGSWPSEQFRKHGVRYEPAGKAKSEIYKDALPLFNSKQVELLDVRRLAAQLTGLERRTSRGGRDSIDHPPSSHDDLANVCCGALDAATARGARMQAWVIDDFGRIV